MSDPVYLTPQEVKDILRFRSKKSAYRLADDPTCPVLRLGGSVRFPRERFLRWLEAHEQGRGRPRGPIKPSREDLEPRGRPQIKVYSGDFGPGRGGSSAASGEREVPSLDGTSLEAR